MRAKFRFGHQRGSSIVCQCRNALSRQSSMNGGSSFLAEITRMTSSLSPLGTDSASMSVTKPHWYSRLASSSRVLLSVLMISHLPDFRSLQDFGSLLPVHHRQRNDPTCHLAQRRLQALTQQFEDAPLVLEQVGDADAVEGAAHPLLQGQP